MPEVNPDYVDILTAFVFRSLHFNLWFHIEHNTHIAINSNDVIWNKCPFDRIKELPW